MNKPPIINYASALRSLLFKGKIGVVGYHHARELSISLHAKYIKDPYSIVTRDFSAIIITDGNYIRNFNEHFGSVGPLLDNNDILYIPSSIKFRMVLFL